MKRIWAIAITLAVITGISISGCNHSNPEPSPAQEGFPAFGAEILDYNFIQAIRNPGVMGLDDNAFLFVGKVGGGYTHEVYEGKCSWSLSDGGVAKFVPVTGKSQVGADGKTASGNVVILRAIAEGYVLITVSDAFGHDLEHVFRVGKGQQYRPDAVWSDVPQQDHNGSSSSSSSDYNSSSSAYSGYNSSSSTYKSSGYNSSSSKYSGYNSSSSKYSGYNSSSSSYKSSGYNSSSSRKENSSSYAGVAPHGGPRYNASRASGHYYSSATRYYTSGH